MTTPWAASSTGSWRKRLALVGPKFVVPLGWNVVLNPAHPSFASVNWEDEGELPFDARLRISPHAQGS